jgi:radical SAM family protein
MMVIERPTISLCPECLKEIPARIRVTDSDVRMVKECPDHGSFDALVERSSLFYMLCSQLDRGGIYNALFVDVTDRCNATCKYCYHKTGDSEPLAEDIISQCAENANLAPFVLVGGEPTMRDDLPELLREIRKIGPVMLATNGLKLADPDHVHKLDALVWPGLFNASISLHPEANNSPGDYDMKIKAIENILATGLNLYGLILVIDSLEQIDEAIAVNRRYPGRINSTRLKIATEINQTANGSGIFTSDVYEYLHAKAQREGVSFDIDHSLPNKMTYFNMLFDGISLSAVKWYSKHTIDLVDIDCAPWHRGKDGKYRNMAHSLVLGG